MNQRLKNFVAFVLIYELTSAYLHKLLVVNLVLMFFLGSEEILAVGVRGGNSSLLGGRGGGGGYAVKMRLKGRG